MPSLPPRCFYSGVRSERAEPLELPSSVVRRHARQGRVRHVLPEHRAQLLEYAERVETHGTRMLITVLGLSLASIAPPFLLPERFGIPAMGVVFLFLAGAIARDPFCTPETLEWFGVERSLRIARACAWILVAVAGSLVALTFLGT